MERKILDTHRQVVEQMSFVRGVMHAEYILGRDDGKVYFLETAARVGGAHIVDLVQASTGINLWREWARVELAQGEHPYTLPEHRRPTEGHHTADQARGGEGQQAGEPGPPRRSPAEARPDRLDAGEAARRPRSGQPREQRRHGERASDGGQHGTPVS